MQCLHTAVYTILTILCNCLIHTFDFSTKLMLYLLVRQAFILYSVFFHFVYSYLCTNLAINEWINLNLFRFDHKPNILTILHSAILWCLSQNRKKMLNQTKPFRCICIDWHGGRFVKWLDECFRKQSFPVSDFTHQPFRLNPGSVGSYLTQQTN